MIIFLLSQSILLPFITGLIRLPRIGRAYRPFFILILIGVLAEMFNYILIHTFHKSNFAVLNMYALAEWTLIAIQFHVWGFLKQKKKVFYGLLIFFTLFWIAENLLFRTHADVVPYFRLLYHFVIVLLSVNMINFMITHDNRNIFRNPRFLICIGFIIYFIYMIICFWAFEVGEVGKASPHGSAPPGIASLFIFLLAYVNALTNIIYAIAFLLIPAPVKFTLKFK